MPTAVTWKLPTAVISKLSSAVTRKLPSAVMNTRKQESGPNRKEFRFDHGRTDGQTEEKCRC